MVKRSERNEITFGFKLLRGRLEKEKQRLLSEQGQLKAEAVIVRTEVHEGSPFGNREDEVTEVLELDKRLALEKRIREQLAEIQYALDKFEQGTYGRCDSCGTAISVERLEAMPQARLCITCKAKQVNNGKIR